MRKRYSVKFKRDVVAGVRAGIKAARIARTFNISASSISRWVKRYRRSKSAVPVIIDPPLITPPPAAVTASVAPWTPSNEEVGAAVCGALDAMQKVINVLQARGK